MPKTLLLADDSITIQKVVGIIFASEDYRVTAVDNGEDALSRIREERPDMVLADVVMPRKNGYELCEAVKSDPELRDVPVLLLAGTFEAFDEARAKAVRADGWLQKPFESAALVGKVREIVEGVEPPTAPALPYVTAGQRPAAASAPPAVVPPPRGAPLPAGARPLPGASTSPFAAAQPFAPRPPAPPPPPPPPFAAARPSPPVRADLPATEARSPFAARPPVPPAPPPPPPSFRAPPPPVRAEPLPADAPFAPVVIPLPPPPPPPAPVPTFDDLDFSGVSLDAPVPAAAPLPLPATPPPAPAIPTQKLSPPAELEPELDFDIDEAAAPIDLADLAAEEISEEEALSTTELHAEVAPLPTVDLSRKEPPALDLSSPWEDELPVAASTPPAPVDAFAGLFGDEGRTPPAMDISAPLDLEAERPAAPPDADDAGDSPFRLDADPLPFRPAVDASPFASAGPRPFELEVVQEREPAFTAMPAFSAIEPTPEPSMAAPEAAPLAPPPPVAVAADEAMLREALSRASRETIERVVWEVVPQLAETIIREQLDRLMKDRKNL